MSWHLVRCATSRVLCYVTEEIRSEVGPAECFYREEESLRASGGMVVQRRPLFQTPYIFAAWETTDPYAWHAVRAIRGVAEIVPGEQRPGTLWREPAVVRDSEVAAWRALADDEGVVNGSTFHTARFEIGDRVEFTFGAFENKVGTFAGMAGRLAGVKIPFLGGETVIYLWPNLLCLIERAPGTTSRTRPCRRKQRGGANVCRRQGPGAVPPPANGAAFAIQ